MTRSVTTRSRAVGVAGVFIETHQDPDQAPSDGPNMIPLKQLDSLLRRLIEFEAPDRPSIARFCEQNKAED